MKTLKEIQAENRRLITQGIWGNGYETMPLTLNVVLRALDRKTLSGHLFDIFTQNLYQLQDGKLINRGKIWSEYKKETLCEQEESVQCKIHQLLTQ